LKQPRPIILAIFSGILFALSWNNFLPAISLFFSFVPLLFILEDNQLHYIKIFNLSFLTFILYHIGTVWWLAKSSIFGFFVIIISNSMYLSLAILLIYRIRKMFGLLACWFSFICLWLSFEYIHYSWELSWPFMNLGNWLGQIHKLIQWYEYTGVLGGTLWILLINLFIYLIIRGLLHKRLRIVFILLSIAILIATIPVFFSMQLYHSFSDSKESRIFKVIQPDIDTYNEKYNSSLFNSQVDNQIKLAINGNDTGIDVFLFPESSFPVYLDEDSSSKHPIIKRLKDELLKNDSAMVLGGLYSFRILNKDSLFYNAAFSLNATGKTKTRHKSKLVIGVEKMPFQDYFVFLKKWNLNFGGFSNSLTIDSEQKNFYSKDSSFAIAPIICYESVYGQYVSNFVLNGASCIVVITNDAWWGDTPGYLQHLMHSKLRAIENRRNVVRSANTGVSCIINGKGDIVVQIMPFSQKTMTGEVFQDYQLSFYNKNGDYIGKMATICSIMLLIMVLIKIILHKYNFKFW
jgi:apolipoprotein N-acyltransferase